jgi:hypothetical protein
MASAAKSLRCVERPRRAKVPAHRSVARAATLGLAAVAVGALSLTVVVAGAGFLLARSFEARTDIRSSLAVVPTSTRLGDSPSAWTAVAAISPGRIGTAFAALVAPVVNHVKTVTTVAVFADPSTDPEHTGSIVPSFKLASAVATLVTLPLSPARAVRDALPLPRARPRTELASLTPDAGLPAKPTEQLRPLKTAIYDITARTVYLPNGERLEAHSGLGEYMDNPRHVSLKNRGSTPPNVYSLRLREQMFHGVRAIRLTPVGDGAMYNRDGILAHSYLLGPSGQSNGCISFKDYHKFLDAFLRGEVERVVVVAKMDGPLPPMPHQQPTRQAAAPVRQAAVASVSSAVSSDPATLRVQ